MYTVAPKSAFKPLIEQKEAPINKNFTEIRISKEKGEKVENVGMFTLLLLIVLLKAYVKDN